MLRFREYYLVDYGAHGTSHGSPYPYDTHVALAFLGAGIPAGTHDEHVHTVDLAPTLADLMGLPAPKGVDGTSLRTNFAMHASGRSK
jgi:arylsulfatase A-like enzyme